MAENIFSTQLQNLRKERRLTQEQLSEALGVSPQAISKWENGNYPDGELVPKIAAFFDVSIDYLYGNARRVTTAEQMIVDTLQRQKSAKEQIESMLDFCWAMQTGNFAESDGTNYSERIRRSKNDTVSGSAVIRGEGFSMQRFNENLEYYMVVKEPEDGFAGYLQADDNMAELFAFLGKKENLKLLMYLLSLDDSEVIKESTIAKRLGISKEQVKSAVAYLSHLDKYDNLFVESRMVDEEDEQESVYQTENYLTYRIIMMLICAKNILEPIEIHYNHIGGRKNAWFRRKDLEFLKK